MSTVYNLEPPPTGKVLLSTTAGDILLELFAKQTPIASRSFLQHCLDGYYDNTIFHRLVPGFIIQGGDPTSTGQGGESIYTSSKNPNGYFEDEIHTRLKWNRRGLLGMANEGRKDTNGGQFFLSLGEGVKELEGRNTMFGRVVGDTIFNLVKMGEAELGDGERPLYPTKVTGTTVLVNPYEDMVKREVVRKAEPAREEKKVVKKGKKKGGKALLSFGDEDGDEEQPIVMKREKVNPMLVDAPLDVSKLSARKDIPKKEEPAAPQRQERSATKVEKQQHRHARRRSSSPQSPPTIKPNREAQLPLPDDEVPSRSPTLTPEPVEKMTTVLDRTNAQIAEIKASMKRNVQTAPTKQDKPKTALEMMMPATAVRGKKRKAGEAQTLGLLNAFMTKLEDVRAETPGDAQQNGHDEDTPQVNGNDETSNTANIDEEAELCDLHFIANCQSCKTWDEQGEGEKDDDKDDGWMSHVLSFEKDRLGKDLTWKRKNEEELMVIDPREKAKDIKEGERAKKMARTGGSKAWDRDRDRGKEPARRAGEKQ